MFHYNHRESLKARVLSFVTAYNFAKHLKALKWKTPFQSICDAWKSNPSAFKINPHHLIQGPYKSNRGEPGHDDRKFLEAVHYEPDGHELSFARPI